MTRKFIINNPHISRKIIKAINKSSLKKSDNTLSMINPDWKSIANLENNSEILVPLLFQKDLRGNYYIANDFLRNEFIYLDDVGHKISYIFSYEDSNIRLNDILRFLDSDFKIVNDIEESLKSSELNQKSMLEKCSHIFLDQKNAATFFEIFLTLNNSGQSIPNYNFLTLEKLDQINQQIEVFRNLPFFLRTNSIPFRIFSPILNKALLFKTRFSNFNERIKNKISNIKNRMAYRPVKDKSIGAFFDIAKMKIDPKSISLINTEKPSLSVIIPVYGKLDFLARCLHSIQVAKTETTLEIIVVDDCGPESVSNIFSESRNGFKIIENKENLGFTNTCNAGAKVANGKYLCFLNSDTIVTDYWSDNLLNGFNLAKNVGVVGPRLLYEDGSLQESGGIVFSNGDAANIGKNESQDNSWFKYFKDVDYVSGAALTILASDFKKIGGFDKRFTPAYYEDTSLCLDVRHKLNKRVVVNPLASVIHHEGATNGTDESKGFKKFQVINKEKFVKKHKKDLKSYGKSYENLWWDRDKYIKGNVLIIDQCVPTPNEDSGSKDMDNILRGLLNQNFRPHLFALSNRGEIPEAYGYYEKGVHCIFGKENSSFRDFYKKFNSLYSLIIVSRVNSYEEVDKILKEFSPDSKKIFYTVDLHHVRLESEFNRTKSLEVLKESRSTKYSELQAIADCDKTVVLSDKEKNYLVNKHGIEPGKILVWPLIRSEFETLSSFKKSKDPKDIIFIGGFRHTPNTEAVKLLENEIVPITKDIFKKNNVPFPGIKIYGSNPNEYINNLKNKDIIYKGFIENEEDAFKNAKISLAPLPFGSGLKGKTLSSLIYRTPVVGSSFAFEGFQMLEKNTMVQSTLDAQEFAQKIFDTYISTDNIDDSSWKDLLNELEGRFSYKSFVADLKNDINNLLA